MNKKGKRMLKKFVTLMLTALFVMIGFSGDLQAKTKKRKAKSEISRNHKMKSKGKYKNRGKRSKKYKKAGNGPDLRALTTETPNTEYTEIPDNGGVNSVEKKTGL